MFLYADGEMQWTTGDGSNGIDGLGGTIAVAGINVGDGIHSVTIPESLIPRISQTSNVGIPGVWMFKVGEGKSIGICKYSTNQTIMYIILHTIYVYLYYISRIK